MVTMPDGAIVAQVHDRERGELERLLWTDQLSGEQRARLEV
jgi:hypothetical protein